MFDSNPLLGREKIAQTIQRLSVFLSPSAVRNILRRGRPKGSKETALAVSSEEPPLGTRGYPGIVSKYANHVWSVDLTIVSRWFVWPAHVLLGIDHFTRKVVGVFPLEGPN
jgi:hypothetical protein